MEAAAGVENEQGKFEGAEGLSIFWQSWRGPDQPRAVVVLVHGAAEHCGRYGYVVERLVPAGFPIFSMDLRGHGRSEGDRMVIDRMANAVADIDQLVTRAREEVPGVPLFLLGHSMGGAIALEYALRHEDRIDALALSAPAADMDTASFQIRLVSQVLTRIAPRLGVFHVDSDQISRDPAEVAAYDNDPLVPRDKLPARTIAEMAGAIATFPERLRSFRKPLLVMHGGDDRITSANASRMVDENAGSTDKTLKIYDGYYHEIFNEPEAERARPIGDLLAWFEAHCAIAETAR